MKNNYFFYGAEILSAFSPSLIKLGAATWMNCESDNVTKGSTDEGIAGNKRTPQTFPRPSRRAGKQSGIIETVCAGDQQRLDNGVGSSCPTTHRVYALCDT